MREVTCVQIWSRTRANAEACAELLRRNVQVQVCTSAREAVHNADIVCTLTACRSEETPILELDMLKPGAHINAVGACQPNFRELNASVVVASRLFVDTKAACLKEPGDLVIPLAEGIIHEDHIVAEIGSVMSGNCEGRQTSEQITLFKSVGAAIEDLCAAAVLYERACAEPEGTFPVMC